jgi:secondary thiamine-phosphate synthase enzyme
MIQTFEVKTAARTELIEITPTVEGALRKAGVKDGICFVFVPHTTAAVTINENADPSVVEDILHTTEKIVPVHDRYRHTEGNSPGHIKASLFGSSAAVFVEAGKLVLGRWQGIFFCEFDGPRTRKVHVKIISTQE